MEQTQLRTVIVIGMVSVGMIQAGYGAFHSDWVLSILGALYAILAVGFFKSGD